MGLFQRTGREHCPGNPENKPWDGGPRSQVAWDQRLDRVRVHGSTSWRDLDACPGTSICTRRLDTHRRADKAGEENGGVPCGPYVVEGHYREREVSVYR